MCTTIERMFLKTLEGGCTAPIGALAEIVENKLQFKGCLFSLDGAQKLEIESSSELNVDGLQINLGVHEAKTLLNRGGADLMKEIKLQMK